jgi:hypothetical protein
VNDQGVCIVRIDDPVLADPAASVEVELDRLVVLERAVGDERRMPDADRAHLDDLAFDELDRVA